MLKIFSDPNHYFHENRFSLNNITKLIWDKEGSKQGNIQPKKHPKFQYEPDINKADVCLLTMSWSHYVDNNKIELAEREINNAISAGKNIVVFINKDNPANIPFKDRILFESGGYKSRDEMKYHSGYPYFTQDYLDLYCDGVVTFREKKAKPEVGFCGHTGGDAITNAWNLLLNQLRQYKYRAGLTKWEPPPFEFTLFRRKILRQFKNDPNIKSNFIIRKQNRAGDKNIYRVNNSNKLTFVNNIINTDYTICMRGNGNYSIRFYEALCLGRIPIFIDTDCLLPFQDEIDYKSLFPWIDINDLSHAAEIVKEFHARLSPDGFINIQKACRKLWVDHMTTNGFYQDFESKISKLTIL